MSPWRRHDWWRCASRCDCEEGGSIGVRQKKATERGGEIKGQPAPKIRAAPKVRGAHGPLLRGPSDASLPRPPLETAPSSRYIHSFMVFIYICRMLQKLKRLSRPPRARYLPAMERTQWPPIMTEHPPVEDDSIGENVECKGHSFAATLADSRMPSDQATREKFGRIWNALKGNTVMGACTLTSSDVHLNAVKLVAVYGDDEGTVVYMTAHTPQTVQRAKAILAKLFETFDQQVKIRIVKKGNIHRFNAIDQARLESMCRTNPMPKIGPPPSGLLPKTKAGLKDYVDVSSDDYDDEDAPVSTTSGLANAPASSWETPHPTLALADAAAPSIMTAEESLADAEDQITTAGRRLEELNLRTAQTETEQTEISSERTKTQLELSYIYIYIYIYT